IMSDPPPLHSSVPPRAARAEIVRGSARPVLMQEIVTLPSRSRPPSAPPQGIRPPSAPPVSSTGRASEEELVRPLASLSAIPTPTGERPSNLDHRGGFLLTFIDGSTSFDDVVDASGLPRGDALSILAELLANGAIMVR